jgi:hypothetical protein
MQPAWGGKMKLEALALIAGLTFFSTATWAADCYVAPYTFAHAAVLFDASTTMTVKSGKTCGSTMHTSFGHLGIRITTLAKNGTALTRGSDRWEYTSRKGFTGSDSFVVSLTLENAISNINVTVNVFQ